MEKTVEKDSMDGTVYKGHRVKLVPAVYLVQPLEWPVQEDQLENRALPANREKMVSQVSMALQMKVVAKIKIVSDTNKIVATSCVTSFVMTCRLSW